MVPPTRIALLLLMTCLSGCGGLSMFEQDTTASLTTGGKPADWTRSAEASAPPVADAPAVTPASSTTSNRPSTPAGSSLFARAAETKSGSQPPDPIAGLVTATAATSGDAAAPLRPPPAAMEQVAIPPRGRAYLFRGVAGLIYSRGMDGLAERINRAGVTASVDTYLMWRPVADAAIREYRRDPAPITLIGHSAGGDSALGFAEVLNAAGIPVSLLVTYDPTRIADDVPPNVERYINIYQSRSIMGGGDVVAGRGFHGHYASVNLTEHREIVHINIEKADGVQEQLVRKIAQLAATPAKGEGAALPIRYVVPAHASIELWDSGMPVTAQAGDTLQTLSATYHVPVWALAEINNISERAAIAAGQRVIVPRNLAPMTSLRATPVSAYAPTAR
jgi:hypothetical protein